MVQPSLGNPGSSYSAPNFSIIPKTQDRRLQWLDMPHCTVVVILSNGPRSRMPSHSSKSLDEMGPSTDISGACHRNPMQHGILAIYPLFLHIVWFRIPLACPVERASEASKPGATLSRN